MELLSDYDCETLYSPRKVNVVADALSRKERIKSKGVRAMSKTLQLESKSKRLTENEEALKDENVMVEMLRGI